jgi:hypothetical protein
VVKYELQRDEAIVDSHDRVHHGGGPPMYNDQLILTNKNLVLVKNGIRSRSRGTFAFPLNQIKLFDGNAQVRVGKLWNGTPALEVYFLNGQEVIGFERAKDVGAFAQSINRLITGLDAPPNSLGGVASITNALVGQVDTLKGMLGIAPSKPGTYPAGSANRVAGQCYACGAPLAGTQGRVATCSYCDTPVQL